MADNVTVDNGSGTDYVVASDDDGTAQHQYVKVEWGADNTQTKVSTGADALPIQDGGNSITVDGTVAISGTVAVTDNSGSLTVDGTVTADTELPAAAALADNTANPAAPAVGAFGHVWDGSTWDRTPGTSTDGVLVNLGANNDVTVTGSVTANAGTNLNTSALALESGGNLAAAAASLSVLDDWDESDRAKVNPIVGQAGVAGGAGAVGATTQRVILPNVSSSTDVSLASSASSQQLLAANTARRGLTLTNTDANGVYIYFGTTATATKFTVFLPGTSALASNTFAYYEMPEPIYTGRIDAIWAADGSGSLIGSEF